MRNGNVLTMRELSGADAPQDVPVRLYLNGRFCGIGHLHENALKFDAMLLEA